MTEPIDPKKLIDISPTTLVKTSSSTLKGLFVILGVLVILFSIYFTVRTLFKPKPTQDITVESGGVVTIKNEAQKKNWYIFTEPYVGVDTENKGYIGIRCGVRWEF